MEDRKLTPTTHVIGKRGASQRPFFRAVKRGIMGVGRLAVAGAIGVGLSNIPIIKEPAVALGKNAAEVAVMMSTNIPATVEDIYWVDLPQSPIFEAGYHEDGSFDPEMLFERWYSAGIDLEDFGLLVELGKISAPTIMGTKDPKMVQGMVEDAQKVNAFIEERYPRAVALLSDPDWLEQHQYVDLVEPVRNYLDYLFMTLYQDMEMDEVSGPGKYVDIQGGGSCQGVGPGGDEGNRPQIAEVQLPGCKGPLVHGQRSRKTH